MTDSTPQSQTPNAVAEELSRVFALGPGALAQKMGIEITHADADRVEASMPVEGNTQPYGLLHGGATCALVETIGSVAAAVGAGPGKQVVGIELNASYLRAATSGTVTAVCTPVRRGRTLSTFLIEVTDDAGRTTATARLTCMTLSDRP